ncbi:hypothetical protein N7540_001745 [Penicillium herquei]|nr:hypothetical protein N7540_001745 [Penicillium herquei]
MKARTERSKQGPHCKMGLGYNVSGLQSPLATENAKSSTNHRTPTGETAYNTDEIDFAPRDYDGRIKRCEERIQQGYSRKTYEAKIKILKAQKANVDCTLGREKRSIGRAANVRAIINAYETGQLGWEENATYWCQGRMIAGPSPFSWSDFRRLNTKTNRANGGFWVEGVLPLAPSEKAMRWTSRGRNEMGNPEVQMIIRLDRTVGVGALSGQDYLGHEYPMKTYPFIDDTGADVMIIKEIDMWELMGNEIDITSAPMAHLMGYSTVLLADSTTVAVKIISVEVNMLGHDELGNFKLMLDDWTTVQCCVFEPPTPTHENSMTGDFNRLAGPWLRSKFYVGSAPEFPFPSLHAGTDIEDLFGVLPVLPRGAAGKPGPTFPLPKMGVIWVINPETGIQMPVASMAGYRAVPPGANPG